MSRLAGVAVCLVGIASPALAEPPQMQRLMHPVYLPPGSVPSVINSHIVYLNPCTGGCTVHQVAQGATDSRTDSSDIGSGTLSAFSGGVTSSKWMAIESCVQGVMAPFNITVTHVDPGTADHFEVMVAGSACQILQGTIGSQCQFVGGIADFAFGGYIPNALVFDFTESWSGYPDPVLQDCATISQEVAHAWGLDHTINRTDPMTYNALQKPIAYQNNATCGSDCQLNGSSCIDPYSNATCTGSCGQTGNSNATHPCLAGDGVSSNQNEIDLITALFGPAGAQAPTLAITSPAAGSAVQSGFEVDVTCTSGDGIEEIDFSFDGVQKASLTTSPAKFTAPTGIKDGSHTISVLCATNKQATQTVTETIIVGEKCAADSDCMMNFICYQQACIAGPGATGGLGDPCTKNSDCASGSCASDGTTSACVVPCATNNDQCPMGTGCLSTSNGSGTAGVCFPGAAHGDSGGCCDAGQGNPAGPLLLSGAIAALWITRRKKAKS